MFPLHRHFHTLSASSRAGSSDNLVEASVAFQTGTRGDRVELVQVTRNNPLLEPFKQIPRDTLSRLEFEVRQGPSRATGKSDILSWDYHVDLDTFRESRRVVHKVKQTLPSEVLTQVQRVPQLPDIAQIVCSYYCHHPTTKGNVG